MRAVVCHTGKIHPRVHAELALERAREAFRSLLDRRVIGKLVLLCDR